MDYQVKCKKSISGFTIIEVIIVIGILVLLIGVADLTYINYRSYNNLEIATATLVDALRHAKANAEQVQADSKWGVGVLTNQIVVFKGNTYSSRDSLYDQPFSLPNGVSSGGLSEIIFEKLTGATVTIGTTTLSTVNRSQDIFINAKGTIFY